jgi:hypothetical protein
LETGSSEKNINDCPALTFKFKAAYGQSFMFFLQVKAATNSLQSIRVLVAAATAFKAQRCHFLWQLCISSIKKNIRIAKLQYCRRRYHCLTGRSGNKDGGFRHTALGSVGCLSARLQ